MKTESTSGQRRVFECKTHRMEYRVQRATSAEPQRGQPETTGPAGPEATGEGAPTAAGAHRGSASTRSLQPQSIRGTPENGRKPHRNRHVWLKH